ncbi:hypothetical protein AL073_14895 [Loktanella sp. 1ANDIMAR09]|nr:hypothetical protein AL073_14895 [Loktanella sp. 1ANDIMAR09]
MISRVDQAVFGALLDQPALEMRDGSKDMEQKLSSGRRLVDALLEADLSDFEVVGGFQELLE